MINKKKDISVIKYVFKACFSMLLIFTIMSCDDDIQYQSDEFLNKDDLPLEATFINVQKIFSTKCISCHSTDFGYEDLSLSEADTPDNLINIKSKQSDDMLIKPGEPELSYLYRKLTGETIIKDIMPQGGSLDSLDIDLVYRWIKNGAEK